MSPPNEPGDVPGGHETPLMSDNVLITGVGDGDGVIDGVVDGVGEAVGVVDGVGLADGVGLTDGDDDGVEDIDGDGEADGLCDGVGVAEGSGSAKGTHALLRLPHPTTLQFTRRPRSRHWRLAFLFEVHLFGHILRASTWQESTSAATRIVKSNALIVKWLKTNGLLTVGSLNGIPFEIVQCDESTPLYGYTGVSSSNRFHFPSLRATHGSHISDHGRLSALSDEFDFTRVIDST